MISPHALIESSGPTQTGMNRLSLTDDDAKARKWFSETMAELGCKVTIDQLGNMFARKEGSARTQLPMIAMGSHLDTQPRGGRYDGILGVVAGVEVMRTLAENNYDTHFDLGVINWTKLVFRLLIFFFFKIKICANFIQRGRGTVPKVHDGVGCLGWSNSAREGVGYG